MFKFAFHLGIHIKCTNVNVTPVLDILDHYPPLPLFVIYSSSDVVLPHPILTVQDELEMYHTLRLHDRIRQIHLDIPSSILHKALVLMDGHFPILEHLFFSFAGAKHNNDIPLTLPETFRAPNLQHLTLPDTSPQRLLQLLTTTASLATLKLSNIQTCYFHPRLLVAHLRLLPQLEELVVVFSSPTPRPISGTEGELLGEEETPVILPKLKIFSFEGVNAYLECLVSQISTPLLEQLRITLSSQIALSQPRLFHLINTTEAFKPLSSTTIDFGTKSVSVYRGGFYIWVRDMSFNWQLDWAAQICNALVPTLSSVKHLKLCFFALTVGPDWQSGSIKSATWHTLLRSFIGVKVLHIDYGLLWELCQALQAGEVGSDPGFLPHLEEITAEKNLFASFIDARRLVGRHVRFSKSKI